MIVRHSTSSRSARVRVREIGDGRFHSLGGERVAGRERLAQARHVLLADLAALIDGKDRRAQRFNCPAMGAGAEGAQPLLDRYAAEIGEFLAKGHLLGQPREQHLVELGAQRAAGQRVLDAAGFDPLAVVHLHDRIERQEPVLDLDLVRQHRDALNEIGQTGRDRRQQQPGFLTLEGAGVGLGAEPRQSLEALLNVADMLDRLLIGQAAGGSGPLE
jgi:hypothetical protein